MREILRRCVVGLGIVALLGGPALGLTFTVDSTADGSDTSAGDGNCVATTGGCTLRAAMEEANALPDADTIEFDIAGSGVHTIHVVGGLEGGSDLPFIVAPLTIDGFKQPGSQPNTNATGGLNAVPTIEVDGSGSSHCFVVFNSGTTTIRGLVINGSNSDAVDLESGSTTFIEGNFIGTDATGTIAKAVSTGINMFVQGGGLTFTVGGTTPAARNLISGARDRAINAGANLSSTILGTIQGNLIGTDKTGTVAVPNQVGIGSGGAGSDTLVLTIGGSTAGAGNVVSGNTLDGIYLFHFATGGTIHGNLIGTDATGTGALGNGRFGIYAANGPQTIGGALPGEENVIAHNGAAGIFLETFDSGLRFAGNAIFANGGLGIDLEPGGLNSNDIGDGDLGANGQQNFPELASGIFPGGTSIDGTLNSTANTTFRVEIFANDACDPSGFGEGQTFVGANDAVMTDGSGNASFTVMLAQSLPAGTILTATATAPDGSTSEFGPCTAALPTTTTTTSTTTSTSTSSTSSTTTSSTTSSSTSSTLTATTTTSSSSSSFSSSTPTSTTTHAPTTTTTLAGCTGVHDGPTFASIICRLQALLDRVNGEPGLGAFQSKLAHTLTKGHDRAVEARDLCAASNAKKSKTRLKQVERAVIQYAHRLSGLPARKKLDEALRQAFLAPAEPLRADTKTVRKSAHCPGDATGG